MSVVSNIAPPACLNTHASDLAAEWKRFHSQWFNFAEDANLYKEEGSRQAAILLAFLGTDAFVLSESMPLTDAQRSDSTAILEEFRRYCTGEDEVNALSSHECGRGLISHF